MNTPGINRYHTGFKRLLAAIIDGIIFVPFAFLEEWIVKNTAHLAIVVSCTILIALLPLIYSIFLHYKYGQTLGKWLAGVKVLDLSETRFLTLKQAVFRDGFFLIVEVIGLFYFLLQANKSDYLQNDYNNDFAAQPIFWWTIIELVTMLTNQKRRAIHDWIAKSVIVRV